MKRLILLMASFVLLSGAPAAAQSAHDLYQQALRKERTEGDLPEAIRLYEQVVRGSDRALGARALLRIGAAYETLGRHDAISAYQRLLRDFADDTASVNTARRRLAVLLPPQPLARTASGLVQRRVWHDPGVDAMGRPTPDGRYLTFVHWDTGDLALRDVATGSWRLLTKTGYPGYAQFSSVSRDGKSAAFLWNVGENDVWHAQLRIIGLDGTGERVLVANASGEISYITPSDWTPDGMHVLVILHRNGANDIALVDTRNGAVRIIKSVDWRQPTRAALSPDGKWIAYDFPTRVDAPERQLFVLAADGSVEYQLTHAPSNDLTPIWTPDGSELLFASDRGGSVGLWRVPMADGRATAEPALIKGDMAAGFYPMGFAAAGALFYVQDTGGGDIYTAEFDVTSARISGEPRRVLQRFQGLNGSAHFSPAGDLLAYMTRRNAISLGQGVRLVIHDLNTGVDRVLPPRGNRNTTRPRFSPDGEKVLLSHRSLRAEDLISLTDVHTGEMRVLVSVRTFPTMLGDAVWSRDGTAVYYFRNDEPEGEGHNPRLVRHDVTSGAERVVHRFDARGPQRAWALSADEQRIAYAARDDATGAWSIRVAALGSSTSTELVRIALPQLIAPFAGLNWTPDERYILYVLRHDERWVGDPNLPLYAVPAAGGEPHSTGLTAHELRHVNFLPDGNNLTFTAGSNGGVEVWVMENLLSATRAQR